MTARLPLLPEERPRTRGDCVDGERPCPWTSCRWHLLLERSDGRGSMSRTRMLETASEEEAARLIDALANEAATLVWSCALDVADQGGVEMGTSVDEPGRSEDDNEDRDPGQRHQAPIRTTHRGDQTLSDIAQAMAVSRERIRQLEAQAIRKFKRNAIGMGLRHVAEGLGERDVKPTIEG